MCRVRIVADYEYHDGATEEAIAQLRENAHTDVIQRCRSERLYRDNQCARCGTDLKNEYRRTITQRLGVSGLCGYSRSAKLKKKAVKYWEIIADNLSKAGWSWGCVTAIDSNGRTTWIVDAHRATTESLSLFTRMKAGGVSRTRINDLRLRRIVLTI